MSRESIENRKQKSDVYNGLMKRQGCENVIAWFLETLKKTSEVCDSQKMHSLETVALNITTIIQKKNRTNVTGHKERDPMTQIKFQKKGSHMKSYPKL